VPYDPEREHATASYRTKQLVVLATDLVLDRFRTLAENPACIARGLVREGFLPACYRRRYDGEFVRSFHNTLELTRNTLVSDIPFLPNTVSELAAHAIFREAKRILDEPSQRIRERAGGVHAGLPEQLEANRVHLHDEIDSLLGTVVEDTDVLALFDVPPDEEPEEHLTPPNGGWSLLRFENWLIPFGRVPRAYITYDGRAWPTEL
jgi:hypothetical protein